MSAFKIGYKVFDLRADKSGRVRKYGPFSGVEYKSGIGKWTPKRNPEVCISGWHFFKSRERARSLGRNIRQRQNRVVYVIEYQGRTKTEYGKTAAESIRLIRQLDK